MRSIIKGIKVAIIVVSEATVMHVLYYMDGVLMPSKGDLEF
jgi:hypothetical protein